jgi:hypothetical protein
MPEQGFTRVAYLKGPEAPRTELEKLLDDTIDAEFMQRGMKASNHRKAILKAMGDAGYEIRRKDRAPNHRGQDR